MDRKTQLLRYLLRNDEILILRDLADVFHVSKRTIRNDLDEISLMLVETGLLLVKKAGVGVFIEGSLKEKEALLYRLENNDEFDEAYSCVDRTKYILRQLFFGFRTIKLKELADDLFVSKATISNDLKKVELWLNKYQLTLITKSRDGIRIQGEEQNYRKAIVGFLETENNQSFGPSMIQKTHRIKSDLLGQLYKLVPLDYIKLEKILIEAESKMEYRFSDEAFNSLFIHIAIAIKRNIAEKPISLPEEIKRQVKTHKEFAVAEEVAKGIEKGFSILFPEDEITYIVLHLIGTKFQQNAFNSDTFLSISNEQIIDIIEQIIKLTEEILKVDLENDKQLWNGLMLHLIPAMNRLRYGLPLKNPLIKEIKRNYPEAFGAASIVCNELEKKIGKTVPDEEIGYIALHLAAAVERQKKKLRTVIICSTGIGTAQILKARLEKRFSNLNITMVRAANDYYQLTTHDVDLIISTIPLDPRGIPIIQVSPVLSENDVNGIDRFMRSRSEKMNRRYLSLAKYIENDFVELKLKIRSKKHLLQYMADKLEEGKYVSADFKAGVLARERISSTEIGNGVAIPHGLIKEVKESVVSIATLEKPILWKDEMVDKVFLICISSEDKEQVGLLMKDIAHLTESIENLETIRNAEQASTIIEMVNL